jgi:hypothetical protein
MGNTQVKNLNKRNIRRDEGEISFDFINQIENKYAVKLPKRYVDFITKHNGACLYARVFNYMDPNRASNEFNSNSIAFDSVEEILIHIENIQSGEEPDWDIKYRFEDGLIPFGDNGGGDLICFDYRKNRDTDNPPIVIWNHDMGFEHRVVFIANSFEEFINMLHEPKD